MRFKNPIFAMELKLKIKNVSLPVIIMLYNVFFAFISIISFVSFYNLNDAGWDSAFLDFISVFFILGILQCAFIFILSPIGTASAIAGERERGTLDLLLASPMRPRQIIFGKLWANMFVLFLFSLSSMPILSIGFIFGEVDLEQCLFFFILICLTAYYCSCIGLYCSCKSDKKIVAFFLTATIELFVTLGNICIIYFLEQMEVIPKAAGYFLLFNPATLLIALYDKLTGSNNMLYLFYQFLGITEPSPSLFLLVNLFVPICIFIQIAIASLFLFLAIKNIEKEQSCQKVKSYRLHKRGLV